MAPSLIVGTVLTIVFYSNGIASQLPGVWLFLYGATIRHPCHALPAAAPRPLYCPGHSTGQATPLREPRTNQGV